MGKKQMAALWLLGIFGAFVVWWMARSAAPKITYYYTPTSYHIQIAAGAVDKTKPIHIAGTVKPESVYTTKHGGIGFILADGEGEIHVAYQGKVTAGEEIIVEGVVDAVGVMQATVIRAKDLNLDQPLIAEKF